MRKCSIMLMVIMLFLTTQLAGEIMYVETIYGDYSINTEDIYFIEFIDNVSADEFEHLMSKIPIQFLKNFPNPIKNTTKIEFQLLKPGKTEVSIYNIKGQTVKTIAHELMNVGNHSMLWNGEDELGKKVANGVYFFKVEQNNKTKIKKMIVLQ